MFKLSIFVRSLFFNFRYLPFKQAVKLPICCINKIVVKHLRKGQIRLPAAIRKGIVCLGVNSTTIANENKRCIINIEAGGTIVFNGSAQIGKGTVISVKNNAVLEFGDGFSSNTSCNYFCDRKIVFGTNCLIGWNCVFHDSNGHKVFYDNQEKNDELPIVIGNHVWIASDVCCQKGCFINDNCIIASHSVVNKRFDECFVLIGGIPAKIIKRNVRFEK